MLVRTVTVSGTAVDRRDDDSSAGVGRRRCNTGTWRCCVLGSILATAWARLIILQLPTWPLFGRILLLTLLLVGVISHGPGCQGDVALLYATSSLSGSILLSVRGYAAFRCPRLHFLPAPDFKRREDNRSFGPGVRRYCTSCDTASINRQAYVNRELLLLIDVRRRWFNTRVCQ